jgi:hypothetical protein
MDVYQKVLLKIYQVTGGKDSQLVDLKDLVKSLGFLGNYNDIFQKLNEEGWIAETPKLNYVKITHWGVKEASNSYSFEKPDAAMIMKKEVMRLVGETKQFLILVEEFAFNAKKANFNEVQKKLNDINSAIKKLEANIE